jgi:hypothetical protein
MNFFTLRKKTRIESPAINFIFYLLIALFTVLIYRQDYLYAVLLLVMDFVYSLFLINHVANMLRNNHKFPTQ